MSISRTLTFTASNLGTDAHLVLTFGTMVSSPTMQPVCWKTVSLSGSGDSSAVVEFADSVALISPKIVGGVVTVLNSSPCEIGERCVLATVEGVNVMSPPVPGDAGIVECVNGTAAAANFALGFTSSALEVEPYMLFMDLPVAQEVKMKVVHTLKIYTSEQYKVGQVITDQPPLVWLGDLAQFPNDCIFTVTLDPVSGLPTITVTDAN